MGHRTSLLSVMEVDGPLMQVTTAAPSPADRAFTTPFPVLQLLTSGPPPPPRLFSFLEPWKGNNDVL